MTGAEFTLDDFIAHTKKGIFFSVKFAKRTAPEIRDMLCRRGVKKHLHGGVLPYNPSEKNLLTVFDIRIQDYRMINLEGLISLNIKNHTYDFDVNNKMFTLRKEI